MIGQALRITIKGVERVTGVRRGHDPLVVGLVKSLVHKRMVKSTVDQVDESICERNEQRELEIIVPARNLACGLVELGVATDLKKEPRGSENGHDGN